MIKLQKLDVLQNELETQLQEKKERRKNFIQRLFPTCEVVIIEEKIEPKNVFRYIAVGGEFHHNVSFLKRYSEDFIIFYYYVVLKDNRIVTIYLDTKHPNCDMENHGKFCEGNMRGKLFTEKTRDIVFYNLSCWNLRDCYDCPVWYRDYELVDDDL